MEKHLTFQRQKVKSLKSSGKPKETTFNSVSHQNWEQLEKLKRKSQNWKEKKKRKNKKFHSPSLESTIWTLIKWNQSQEPFLISGEMGRSSIKPMRTSWRKFWSITPKMRLKWKTLISSRLDHIQSSIRQDASSLWERMVQKKTFQSVNA